MAERQILDIKSLTSRARETGFCVSEYTVRRAIRGGLIPCRCVGRTYLIPWDGFVRWITCQDGADNYQSDTESSKIRRVEVG